MNKPFDHTLLPYLADYDLAPPLEIGAPEQQGVNNASLIVRSGNGDYIARAYISKSYDDPASIGYEHHLLNRLADARLSFAVPVPIPTRNGARDFVSAQGRFGVIWGRGRLARPRSNAGTGETPAPPGLLRANENSRHLPWLGHDIEIGDG